MMDESALQSIAAQLRKPVGDAGKEMAERMNVSNHLMNMWTFEKLRISPSDNILEIGMGNGLFVKDIASVHSSVKYTGFDYSETMVEEATRHNPQFIENGQVQFVQGSVDALPFSENAFNKAFAVNVIYFWETPEKELAELHRVLTPHGMLIITVRPESTMHLYPFAKYGFTQYSERSLSELLSRSGFRVTNVVEMPEPEMEINGEIIQRATLIISSEKSDLPKLP